MLTQQIKRYASFLDDLVKEFEGKGYPSQTSVQMAIAALNASALQNISESLSSLDTREIAEAIACSS